MIKLKFNSAIEMISWLMDNESKFLADNYGRKWKYLEYTFYFQDLSDTELMPGIECIHLYGTDLYGEI